MFSIYRSTGALRVAASSRKPRAVATAATPIFRSLSSSGSSKVISPYFIPLFPDGDKKKAGNNNKADADAKPPLCDVVQGPSLLRTPAPRPHPTLMFLPGLRSLPFWTSEARPNPNNPDEASRRRIAYNDPSVTKAVQLLESNAEIFREEYLRVAPSLPSDYAGLQDHVNSSSSSSSGSGSGGGKKKESKDTTLHDGDWDWHTYLSKGNVQGDFVMKFPETSKILNDGLRGKENNYQLFEGTPFGFGFFSNLGGGAKIAAHNAPTNLRLRIHLPIIVKDNDAIHPKTGLPKCGIRVATSVRSYQQDQAMVLDDAYDHDVWNDTSENRVVLLVDIWHPDVTQAEKEAVVDMFQAAKRDGLWKR